LEKTVLLYQTDFRHEILYNDYHIGKLEQFANQTINIITINVLGIIRNHP